MTAALVKKEPEVVPGVYDIPEETYHADPVPGGSLSHSGAKLLLPPNCPAMFKYYRDHGRPNKAEFDFGHVAHELVLGKGAGIAVVDARDWRTNKAKEERDKAYAEGKAPVLREEYERAQAMADAIRRHPLAGRLLDLSVGFAEQSIFWQDRPTGIWRRARLDFIRPSSAPGSVRGVDLKTTTSANPEKLRKAIWDYDYCGQGAWYIDALRDRGIADQSSEFAFVFVEKTPPHLITVARLDALAMRAGRERNREAIDVYVDCVARDEWASYTPETELSTIRLPRWIENEYRESW